jgi:quercetin dioxygenase-like cupin family protein
VEQERVREREPQPGADKYEETLRERAAWVERVMTGQVLIRSEDRQFERNRQGHIKFYLNPQHDFNTALDEWIVFQHDIKRQSGKHRHQGGLVIFVLEGEGTTDVNGYRLDWQPWDLLLLPIQPNGVTHQHYNRDPERGARWQAFIYKPFSSYLMDQIVQVEDLSLDQSGGAAMAKLQTLGDVSSRIGTGIRDGGTYQPLHLTSPAQLAETDLMEELYRLRDHQRHLRDQSSWLVRGADLPWQTTAQGILRWYLHPALDYACIRTLIFYMQQIPGGSRSGRQRHGGNAVFQVLEGRGHTVLDGVTFPWKTDDMITLPNRPDGVVYQHFNDDPEKAAVLVGCEPNMTHTIDLDRGSGFEQLEACPEYRALR